MLRDYALVPDVFDEHCYSCKGICHFHLKEIKDELLNAAIVRDLCDGEWRTYIEQQKGRWHPKAKELLKKLGSQNRFFDHPAVGTAKPSSDIQWAHEAIATHAIDPLSGVIMSHANQAAYAGNPIASSIEKLDSTVWWKNRPISIQVKRQTSEYVQAFRLLLTQANSLLFIDPYIDPEKHSYREFGKILLATKRAKSQPRIEIHRVCYFGSGPGRTIEDNKNWEKTFRKHFEPVMKSINNSLEVFIWHDFHRRYLISDLMGVFLDDGLDLSSDPNAKLQIGRLDRNDRDGVQREFDPAVNKPRHRFIVS